MHKNSTKCMKSWNTESPKHTESCSKKKRERECQAHLARRNEELLAVGRNGAGEGLEAGDAHGELVVRK
jgi:hypothetical protein